MNLPEHPVLDGIEGIEIIVFLFFIGCPQEFRFVFHTIYYTSHTPKMPQFFCIPKKCEPGVMNQNQGIQGAGEK